MGQRVANVYDLDDRTYLIKFALPGKAEKVINRYKFDIIPDYLFI